MPRIRVQLLALLLLTVSTVLSAPNSLDEDLKLIARTEEGPSSENIDSYQNNSSSTASISAEAVSNERPRTLIMYGVLRWLLGIFKAMIKPARNMYIMMGPEITAFRCLSQTREFENFMGFSGSDFEGYVYETPRGSYERQPSDYGVSNERIPSDQGLFSNDLYDPQPLQNVHQYDRELRQHAIHPDTHDYSENNSYDDPSGNSLSQTIQHRADEVLKRIPRFIDEFSSLLKEGQAMSCIMPYMRERVTRWLDS